jgi:hypothetical protein
VKRGADDLVWACVWTSRLTFSHPAKILRRGQNAPIAAKDAPVRRDVCRTGRVRSSPILGGLHHQYVRVEFPTGTPPPKRNCWRCWDNAVTPRSERYCYPACSVQYCRSCPASRNHHRQAHRKHEHGSARSTLPLRPRLSIGLPRSLTSTRRTRWRWGTADAYQDHRHAAGGSPRVGPGEMDRPGASAGPVVFLSDGGGHLRCPVRAAKFLRPVSPACSRQVPTSDMSGYKVNALKAISVLEKASPEAAQWWRTNTPHMMKRSRMFLFHEHVCEVVE